MSRSRKTTSGPLSERRDVTVVFVDATDFTATSSRLDTEDVYAFIDEAMSLLADVVMHHEGTIDKFTGDGLMALFGAPTAHEDDAHRAVRAAWEMQRVIRPLREKLKEQYRFEFRIRVGVHTGEVVAGRIGGSAHAEYTVIGDTVNLAARLQTAAEPDTVLVSAETHLRTAMSFEYQPLPPLTLKGIPYPVTAYKLLGTDGRAVSTRGVPGALVPLIGREEPLRQLRSIMRRAIDGKQTEVVFVSGEAGVGKTRLINEFSVGLDFASVDVHGAACVAVTRSRPLTLIADLLRSMLGISADDGVATQAEIIRSFCVQHKLPAEEVAPYLVSALGIDAYDEENDALLRPFNDEMLQLQTHAALRRVILAVADKKPLLLVFDDVHWIDSASADFLTFFLQSFTEEPMLIVCVARQIAADDAALPLLTVARTHDDRFCWIDVAPLSTAECHALVKRFITSDAPDARALRQRIVTRAEGNPLYVEELLQMVHQRGGLRGTPGKWEVAPNAESLLRDVPHSLRALIMARFDSLAPPLRRVLQRAAIVGRAFPIALIQQLVPGDDVAAALEELSHRDFVQQEPFGVQKGYAFTHALLQEAIQATVLKRDRQDLHLQIAEVIARQPSFSPKQRNELLAHHYGESRVPARALPFLIAAAEQAMRRHANDIVVEHCRRALAILDTTRDERVLDRYRVDVILARAMKFLGQLGDAAKVLTEVVTALSQTLAWQSVDPEFVPVYVEAIRELADVEAREGAFDDAFRHLEEGYLASSQWSDLIANNVRFALEERMAWIRFQQGRYDEALKRADSVLRAAEQEPTPDPTLLANLYNTVGGVQWRYGKHEAAADHVRRALTLFHQIGYLFGKANLSTNLGVINYAQGQWLEAVRCFERADWIRREIGCSIGRSPNLLNLGLLYTALGDHSRARATLEASLRIAQQLGEKPDITNALLRLAYLTVVQNRFREAAEFLGRLQGSKDTLPPACRVQFDGLMAMIESDRSLDDAIEIARRGFAFARDTRVPEWEADSARVLGSLLIKRGCAEEACEVLNTALVRARSAGDSYKEAQVLFELGLLQRQKMSSDATRTLEESLRIFTQLGAAYDAQRVTAMLAS